MSQEILASLYNPKKELLLITAVVGDLKTLLSLWSLQMRFLTEGIHELPITRKDPPYNEWIAPGIQ